LAVSLTVTPLSIYGDGPKVGQGNKVVAPEDNPNSAEPAETLKECLQEGFAKGWAKGWRQRDFQKQTMSCTEISKKMIPDCLWLQGYLMDRK
jgi:hypothetical protein